MIEKLRDDKKKLEKACEYLRKKVQWVLDNEQHMREQLILQSVKNAILSKEMKNTKAEIVRLKSERFMADEEMKSVKYLQEQIMQLNSKNAFLTKEMECIANEKVRIIQTYIVQAFACWGFSSSQNSNSTADICRKCAKCGKGLEFGTNEALIV